LDDFSEKTDSLCFQQIEAEEGTLHGGKTTVRLYGVTEVSNAFCSHSTRRVD
jgi:DNA polymerase delta subunit 1